MPRVQVFSQNSNASLASKTDMQDHGTGTAHKNLLDTRCSFLDGCQLLFDNQTSVKRTIYHLLFKGCKAEVS